MTEHLTTCTLCEAMCGLVVRLDGERVTRIEGDPDDHHSRGHICPKATALADLQHDPHWLQQPMRRDGDTWTAIGWDAAFELAGRRLGGLQRRHGRDAVGLYFGNPTGHDHRAVIGLGLLQTLLGSRHLYSAASVDQLPRTVTAYLLYGNQARLPSPDVDRTDLFLIFGANPVVSQGSVMTAPGMKRRLKALRARGGRLVVVDPRRTETAALADTHLFIRPGTDGLLVAALLHVVLASDCPADLEPLRARLTRFTPEAVAPATGIDPAAIRRLADDFAAAERAVAYGRMGISVNAFGTTITWLIDALNYATGNLDAVGGAMFGRPAVDLPTFARLVGQAGGFDAPTGDGLPVFNHERPVAGLAPALESGELRGLITHAGNPALSLPGARRLDRALAGLDFFVAIDPRINETTRHAHLILPPPRPLERDWYGLVFNALALREVARYNRPVLPAPHKPDSFAILTRLARGIVRRRGVAGALAGPAVGLLTRAVTPNRIIDVMLRTGPHRLSLAKLAEHPRGLDLGERQPGVLKTPPAMTHPLLLADLDRLADTLDVAPPPLVLIGRRTLRSMNSWLHDSPRMVKGRPRCTAQLHPDDAAAHGLESGDAAIIRGDGGEIELPVEVTDDLMPGVVSVPHGWGHGRPGTRQPVASAQPGVSYNDVLDGTVWDPISGVSALNGLPISLAPGGRRPSPAEPPRR